jgi:heme oxygenase
MHAGAIVQRLDSETRRHHIAADAMWLDLLRADVAIGDYIECLADAYGFEAPLEVAWSRTPGLDLVIDRTLRTRARLLERDLMVFGIGAARTVHVPARFAIAEALGWMYVVERAYLLHAAVRRHLAAHLPQVEVARSYLDATSEGASERWRLFANALDEATSSRRIVEDIARGAHDAFRCWRRWRLPADQRAQSPVSTIIGP